MLCNKHHSETNTWYQRWWCIQLAGNHSNYSTCKVKWINWLDSQPRWHLGITTVRFNYVIIWYTNNIFYYLPSAECEQTKQLRDDNAELDTEVPKCSQHRRGSTEGYDVESRMTLDHLHTDRQTTHIAVQRVTMLRVVWPWTTYTQTDTQTTHIAVQRVTMLRVVWPWTTYTQTDHTHSSTEGYDVEGRMTLDHLHTDRQTDHIAVQRVTMLRVVWPWTTYTQTDHPHSSTKGYNVEGRMTMDHLHIERQTTHMAV